MYNRSTFVEVHLAVTAAQVTHDGKPIKVQ